MIWDDVTALYDGKAYVGTGVTYGVLDPEATLAKIDHITQSNCYPEGLRKASPAPAGEEPEEVSAAVTVKAEHLNIRKMPVLRQRKQGRFSTDGPARHMRSKKMKAAPGTGSVMICGLPIRTENG